MARTTLDIDAPILDDVKRIQEREGGSLGAVVSRLLAEALSLRARETQGAPPELRWTRREMGARVDLRDKEALYRILDASSAP